MLRDNSLIFEVMLCSDYDDVLERELAVEVVLVYPVVEVIERVRVRYIKD